MISILYFIVEKVLMGLSVVGSSGGALTNVGPSGF
jgi:hypothetical protein